MIKEIRNIETNELEGYDYNGIHIPLDPSNRHYKKVMKLLETEELVPAFTEEERLDHFKSTRISRLNSIADKKQKEAEKLITGQRVSDAQLKRYETKYQQALKAKEDNNYNYFELEAKLISMDPKDLVNLIINKHNEWLDILDEYVKLIEAYRIKAKSIINSLNNVEQFEVVDKYLNKANSLGSNISEEIILNVFDEFKKDLKGLDNE